MLFCIKKIYSKKPHKNKKWEEALQSIRIKDKAKKKHTAS